MTFLGTKKNLKISTGELIPRRLLLGEMKPGIFDLLGDNFVGIMYTRPVGSGVLGCMSNCWGSWGEVEQFPPGVDNWKFYFSGEEGLEYFGSAGDTFSGFSGSAGDRESEL